MEDLSKASKVVIRLEHWEKQEHSLRCQSLPADSLEKLFRKFIATTHLEARDLAGRARHAETDKPLMICSLIEPNLWVGPTLRTPEEFTYLQSLKITAILSLQNDDDRDYNGVASERAAAVRVGLAFENIAVKDFNNTELQQRLPECVKVLERLLSEGHTVYVHCHAGITRSPTVVAAHLHWCCGWKLDEALAHVRHCRPCFPIEDAIRNALWQPTLSDKPRP